MEAGYLSIEIEQLELGYKAKPDKDPQVRLDLAISNAFNIFQWVSTGDEKFSTSVFTPMFRPSEDETSEVFSYINGFSNQYIRSTFIDLNDEVMNGLANASLVMTVVSLNDKVDAAPAKPAKGAPPPEAKPAEETLIKLTLPLHALLTAKNCTINLYQTLSEVLQQAPFNSPDAAVIHASLLDSASALNIKISTDNDFAEYVLGSKIFRWERATLAAPPAVWGLHAPDVTDPKAKVPPTEAELRSKYLDNIARLVNDQANICSFDLSIGVAKDETAREVEGQEEETTTASMIHSMFPYISLGKGKIHFNSENAATVPTEEDIRSRGDLWNVSWGGSCVLFMHRKVARKFTLLLFQDPSSSYLPVTMKKSPAAQFMEVEGGEQTITGRLNIQSITNSGTTSAELSAVLDDDAPGTSMLAYLGISAPLLPTSALDKLTAESEQQQQQQKERNIPQGLLSNKVVSSADANRDVLKELRAEISATIEKVGQEYVSLYPEPTQSMPTLVAAANSTTDPTTQTSPRSGGVQTQEERKAEFMEFLMTNGIFHELKESLKPKVQMLIRERYGNRGRALGKSPALATVDMNGDDQSRFQVTQEITEGSVETLLSELYVFLVKECSLVLNSMFTDTIIGRDVSELEKAALVDDEAETPVQVVERLLRQAADAAASGAYDVANAIHLERMQIINHSPEMGSNIDVVHKAHAAYGEFLLHQSASVLASVGTALSDLQEVLLDKAQSLLGKARSALYSAYQVKPSVWQVGLLYAGVLVELDQSEQAEVILREVLGVQLVETAKETKYDLQSFSEFDGYDSDALCPVDPMCYSVLAALFNMQGDALKARKALLLANRSYSEGSFKPDVSTHGSPRRTIVLTLSETSLHLFKHSLVRLAQSCVQLAVSSEEAVTAKATARGKPASTVPHIKYLLLRARSVSLLYGPSSVAPPADIAQRLEDAVQLGKDSQLVADCPSDEVHAWATLAIAQQLAGADASVVMEAYLNAIGCSRKIPLDEVKQDRDAIVPLGLFVQTAKLLLLAGRFRQARTILLYACSVYSSASLFMLLGACYLRLDELEEAEAALVEANLLDNRNPSVWAYLSLVCLAGGPHRMVEAEKSLEQALRLGQDDALLLRELSTSFMSVDKLQIAEDLIRRALRREMTDAASSAVSSKYTSNARTRRLLADILAGQNQAVKAVDEYQRVIADEYADLRTKLGAAERCCDLLTSLGREEELITLKSIMAELAQGEGKGDNRGE